MGIIHEEVHRMVLAQYPDQVDMLKPFLYGFDVTYGERKKLNNTILFAYLLKPEDFIKNGFGKHGQFRRLICYSTYFRIEIELIH